MKSINHEELTKYRNYKSYENISIEDINKHLENPLTRLETNILTKFTEKNKFFFNNMFNVKDLLENRHLSDVLKFTKINLKLLNINVILKKLIDNVTDSSLKNKLETKLNNSFDKSNKFRTIINSIFNSNEIFNSNDTIDLNLIFLKAEHSSGWEKIQQNTKSYDFSSIGYVTNYNSLHKNNKIPTKNIHNSNEKKDIDKYINECNQLQERYVTKHNEIIKLYNALKKIIELKLNLINIILSIMNVIEVNITKYGIIVNTKIDYDEEDGILKIPKTLDIINNVDQELNEYARTLKNARKQGADLRFPKSAIKANPLRFRPYNR